MFINVLAYVFGSFQRHRAAPGNKPVVVGKAVGNTGGTGSTGGRSDIRHGSGRGGDSIPLGLSYALWSGIGTVVIVLVGRFAYGQMLGPTQLIGIGLITAGVVLVNLGK